MFRNHINAENRIAIKLNPIIVYSVHSQAFHSKLFVKWKEENGNLTAQKRISFPSVS